MKKSTLIITIIVVLLVGSAGATLYVQSQNDNDGDEATNEQSDTEQQPSGSDPGPEDTTTESDEVAIRDFAFEPANITIPVGTTVTWTNEDSAGHNVIASDPDNTGGLPTSAPLLSEGESFSYTFTETGTFEYICEPHPYMQGVVEVVDAVEE